MILHRTPYFCRLAASLSLGLLAFMTVPAMLSQATEPAWKSTYNYIYAQRLVDETVRHHPELTALVMHVTPPGNPDNFIIASNIWLTGQKSDPDDVQVITSGVTNTETNKAGTKYEVELVLNNSVGHKIGSVATVFPYKAGASKANLNRRAIEIRDELSRRILSEANLIEPFPYSAQTPVNTYAQELVDRVYAKYAQLLAMAIHTATPNGPQELIVGSTFGRLGKPSDANDLKVSHSGKATFEAEPAGGYEAILPLKDATGKIIGTLNLLLPKSPSADATATNALAEAIGQEVSRQISGVTVLYEPVHE